MLANLLPIHPEDRLVIRRTYTQIGPRSGLWFKVEILLVPHQPLVPEELRLLRIPVAGYLDRLGLGEVVIHRPGISRLGLLVHKPSTSNLMFVKVVKPCLIWVWNHMPVSVERKRRPLVRTGDDNRSGWGSGWR